MLQNTLLKITRPSHSLSTTHLHLPHSWIERRTFQALWRSKTPCSYQKQKYCCDRNRPIVCIWWSSSSHPCPIHPHCDDPLKANSVRSIRTDLIRETSHLPARQEAMCVYGSFDSQFVHVIRNIGRSKTVLAETDMIYVYILRSKTWKNTRNALSKHVRFAILARKGISIVARMGWQRCEFLAWKGISILRRMCCELYSTIRKHA